MLGTAYDNIWLDTHSLKFFYAAWVGFVFNSPEADRYGISVTWIRIALSCPLHAGTDGLPPGTADFRYHQQFHPLPIIAICVSSVVKSQEETALDLICDVRDYLHSSSAIITAAALSVIRTSTPFRLSHLSSCSDFHR